MMDSRTGLPLPTRDIRFDYTVLNLLNDIAYLIIHSHDQDTAAKVMDHLEAARKIIVDSISDAAAADLPPAQYVSPSSAE